MNDNTKENVWMAVWSIILASIAIVMIQKASTKDYPPTFRHQVHLLESK